MSTDDKQALVDALGDLAWALDAQGRKADSRTCTSAAIWIAGSPEYVHRQSGSFDGQACAAAMRAYFSTDSGRTSIEVQPVSNPYLRNRIEAAFIAGWDAAAQRCEHGEAG
jgi:hypothetical protein